MNILIAAKIIRKPTSRAPAVLFHLEDSHPGLRNIESTLRVFKGSDVMNVIKDMDYEIDHGRGSWMPVSHRITSMRYVFSQSQEITGESTN